jgi:hypothetical protein
MNDKHAVKGSGFADILAILELHNRIFPVIKFQSSSPSGLYLAQAVVNPHLDLSLLCLIPSHLHTLHVAEFGSK